jgi:hypothetical protein
MWLVCVHGWGKQQQKAASSHSLLHLTRCFGARPNKRDIIKACVRHSLCHITANMSGFVFARLILIRAPQQCRNSMRD